MKRITKGFLLGPLVVPLLIAMVYMVLLLVTHNSASIGGILFSYALVGGAGLVMAYLYAAVAGVPIYLLYKRYGLLRLRHILFAAFIAGGTFPVLLQLSLTPDMVAQFGVFGGIGMIVAYAIWYIGIRETPVKD